MAHERFMLYEHLILQHVNYKILLSLETTSMRLICIIKYNTDLGGKLPPWIY